MRNKPRACLVVSNLAAPEPYPTPQSRNEVCRPLQSSLARPMANVGFLNTPVYDIKLIEASFDLVDI
jgi:hypothetical protein